MAHFSALFAAGREGSWFGTPCAAATLRFYLATVARYAISRTLPYGGMGPNLRAMLDGGQPRGRAVSEVTRGDEIQPGVYYKWHIGSATLPLQ